mgnify:CR=1 FL=1
MVIVPFEPGLDLIYTNVRLKGPRSTEQYTFALDTACSITTISPSILDDLGYEARSGIRRTTVTTALGEEPGYLLRVSEIMALGHTLNDLVVHVHDLAENSGVTGLIGLNFLNQFNYEVRSAEGRLFVSPVR